MDNKLLFSSNLKIALFYFGIICLLSSCSLNDRTEKDLTSIDIAFIKKTCKLDSDEKILLFETNVGFQGYKQGGNFITNKRVVSYWIKNNEETVETAYYHEIDSLKLNDKSRAVTVASSLTIYKTNGSNFELFIDADSSRLNAFYVKTLEVWNKNKK